MSTDLVTTDLTSMYPVLDPKSDLAEAMKANSSGGIDRTSLPTVSMPTAGNTQWSFTSAMGQEITAKAIVGIPVSKKKTGVLYPVEGGGFGKPPVLRTDDCITATRISDDLGDIDPDVLEAARIGDNEYDWQKLEYAQFGSASNGFGKRVNEYLEIAMLQENEAYPIVVRVSAGSIRVCESFIQLMPCVYWGSIIELGLVKAENKNGNAYSQVKPKLVDVLPKDVRDNIKQLYSIPLGAEGV